MNFPVDQPCEIEKVRSNGTFAHNPDGYEDNTVKEEPPVLLFYNSMFNPS